MIPALYPTVSEGHYKDALLRTFVTFPHTCPGLGCAIRRWIRQSHAKQVDTALTRHLPNTHEEPR